MKLAAALSILLTGCLVLSSISYGFPQQGEDPNLLRIGLLRFSRSVFSDSEEKMGDRLRDIEQQLQAKRELHIRKYLGDEEISYEEIADPDNYIDNTLIRGTMRKLAVYCRDHQLDGIIFGHFDQTNDMNIIFRFYYSDSLAQRRGIGNRNRIKSFSRAINFGALSPRKVTSVTNELMAELAGVIGGPQSVRPQLERTPPVRTPRKTPEPKDQRQKIEPKVQKTPVKGPIIKKMEGEPSTFADVYRMIIGYGFYCDPYSFKGHSAALLEIGSKENIKYNTDIDYFNRRIQASTVRGEPDIVESTSLHKVDEADNIKLQWARSQMRKLIFQEAQKHIDKLNEIHYGGFNDWRIPTIKELFSVIEHTDRHHRFFPFEFKKFDLDGLTIPTEIDIWSSSLVDKVEKDFVSDSCRNNEAYFIIRKTEDRLGFHISCEIYNQYVIPVRTPTARDKDILAKAVSDTTSQKAPSQRPSSASTTGKYYIYQLPFTHIERGKPYRPGEIAKVVKESLLLRVLDKIHSAGLTPLVDDPEHKIPGFSVDDALQILNMPAVNDNEKIERITREYMRSYNIDVILSGWYDDSQGSGKKVRVWPILIFNGDKKLFKAELVVSEADLISEGSNNRKKFLGSQVQPKLRNLIEQAFAGRFGPKKSVQTGSRQSQAQRKQHRRARKRPEVTEEPDTSPPSPPQPPPTLKPLYASQLAFIDKSRRPVRGIIKRELEFLTDKMSDEIIRHLTNLQRRFGKKLIVNKEGRRIPNTPEQTEELIEFAFDKYIPNKEKRLEKIIEKKMNPFYVDAIITGQYIFKGRGIYEIRPIVILKSGIITQNFILNRAQLVYRTSQHFKIRFRTGGRDILEEKVKELFTNIQ